MRFLLSIMTMTIIIDFLLRVRWVLWVFQKRNLLKEWSPSVIASKVSKPLKHMSVSNKDYLIITDSDGNLILKNRRGRTVSNPFG